ncbi:uncharacterized protein LOC113225720 [Hyposmocoma kahamanoa]|uniref:uncharacterized protein LOC113225720 n=1 Tax=Hyposmocoma kahamanoa TaxID=1477025 RepID=UPI000E6DA298|nr:uncharacterized protein LOC113225720 [Hyposmocoma kahamanoa]
MVIVTCGICVVNDGDVTVEGNCAGGIFNGAGHCDVQLGCPLGLEELVQCTVHRHGTHCRTNSRDVALPLKVHPYLSAPRRLSRCEKLWQNLISAELKSKDECPPYFDWNLAKTLSFLVKDPVGPMQIERIVVHLKDFSVLSNTGFKIDALDDVCIILDFLYESLNGPPEFREGIISILENCAKPILLNVNSDIVTYFDSLRNIIGYLGYLLMRSEDDDIFDMVSKALVWQMSAPNSKRGIGTARLQQILAASAKVLYQTSVRMLAIATPHRFPAYLDIVFLLACDSVDNCLDLMEENIFENIFYRFNPYFPEKPLPLFEINPDLDSIYLKLGASTVHMSTTLSLLLVLLQTMKNYVADHPDYAKRLPCPDDYAQRCFIWAYRYECRARGHRHERITMTVISNVLLHIFGERLATFCNTLMQDVLTLSVVTELPPLNDWTRTVNFNPSQQDVQFKKMLIYLSVDFFKTCPQNTWMAEHLHWVTGLMYLIDPGLCSLRTNWTAVLFSELRKVVLQAFTIVLPKINKSISSQHNIIRRIMWYIEWYSESPFELALLYWCVRVLQTCMSTRGTKAREDAIEVMFNSHGLIILLQLVYKLLEQKTPPLEKVQVIIAVILRILTSTTIRQKTVSCCVYPQLKWPLSINKLGNKMLRIVLRSLEKHCIVSNRWMISLLTFIWHAVVWKDEYRNMFIANKGVYQLLDLVTLTCYPVQCVALGLLVDIAYAGEAVSQLVTWRAGMQAVSSIIW